MSMAGSSRRVWIVIEPAELLQRPVLAVARDDEDDRHAVLGGGPQPADRVMHRAVAEQRHHPPGRVGELKADGSGQAPATSGVGLSERFAGQWRPPGGRDGIREPGFSSMTRDFRCPSALASASWSQ
jgi:hypothetical protein